MKQRLATTSVLSVQSQDNPLSKLYEKQTTAPIANAGFCAARFASEMQMQCNKNARSLARQEIRGKKQ